MTDIETALRARIEEWNAHILGPGLTQWGIGDLAFTLAAVVQGMVENVLKTPHDPARSVARMLQRMDAEDKQSFNFCIIGQREQLAEQAREIERLETVLDGMREADRIARGVTVSDWTPPPGWHSWADKCAALSAALERRGCHAPIPPECPSCEPSLAALRATPETGG